ALPYILKEINVPVYATKLTVGLIDRKLKEHKLLTKTKRKVVKHGSSINLGAFRIEFIKTNHSIADASALAIYSPAGVIVHTGDFKIDYTPLFGDAINLQRFGEIGKKGVLALLCDSTNAQIPGFNMSETLVARTFDNLFNENKTNRIIVATFASNVDRVQQIINTAHKFGRKVILQGRSMLNVIEIAAELGYVEIPDNILIDVEEMNNYPDEKLVFITTGSQGEAMAALSRMANSTHRKISIKPGDRIIFSSTPIPGNEKAVSKVVNELSMKGAKVIFEDTHVSGHARQEEINLIYSLVKPKYAIPIHGEYRHRTAQADLVNSLEIEKENIFILQAGNVLELSQENGKIVDQVPAKAIFVDGLGVGDVGNVVVRDRQQLAANGVIIVIIGMSINSNQIHAKPEIISRGFIYVRESDQLIKEIKQEVNKTLEKFNKGNTKNLGKLKNEIRNDLNEFLWVKMKRSPVILPIIIEIEKDR
ncbi:MAG TPA: ribonuclease J, partial [Clostridiales bacterium]|nr:ribonuclease J [Clostridiales bacterium]